MLVKRKMYNSVSKMVIPIETGKSQKVFNTYDEITGDYIEGGITSSDSGFDTTITEEDAKEMLANPEDNIKELSNLMTYYYITNGEVYSLYTMMKTLPTLNYKVGAFDNTIKRYELSMSEIAKALHKTRYKELTRDIIGQLCVNGTVVCLWLGQKKNPYLHIFENGEYVFPRYRLSGEWIACVDMAMFDDMREEERLNMFTNLSPYVTETMYNAYKNDTQDLEKKYVDLPQDRTVVIRGDVVKRNQRIGTPLGTQAILDLIHKETLKNLEKSISNRVEKNVGILTIGNDEDGKSFVDINPMTRKSIITGVGKALKQSNSTKTTQVPIVSLPEFANLQFSKVDNLDALKPEKFETVNNNLAMDTGVSPALTTGSGSNFAGAKMNLDYIYRRIGAILEQIDLVFEKMFKIILPKNVADNFFFEFDKSIPMSKEDEIGILMQLASQGYSTKAVVDLLSSIGWDDLLEQSIYEIDELKLREIIVPPLTSFTMTSDDTKDDSTKQEDDDTTNDNTVASKTSDGNSNPEPSV